MLKPHRLGIPTINVTVPATPTIDFQWIGKINEDGITVEGEETVEEVLSYLTGTSIYDEIVTGKSFQITFNTREFSLADRKKYFNSATVGTIIPLEAVVGLSKRSISTPYVLRPIDAIDDAEDWFFSLGAVIETFSQTYSGSTVEEYEVTIKFYPIIYQVSSNTPVRNSWGRIGAWETDFLANDGQLIPANQVIEQ